MINIDDIKNITFKKAKFGGYRPFEVEMFIDDVNVLCKSMQKENARLTMRIRDLEKKLEKYQEEESSIRNAILSAQKLADNSIIDADNKSKNILFDASQKADKIIRKAKDEAEKQRKAAWDINMKSESFRRELVKLYEGRLSELRAELPSDEFLKNTNETDFNEVLSKEISELDGGLDKNHIFEVKFSKQNEPNRKETEVSENKIVYEKKVMQDIDSGICKEKKQLKNLKFGTKYRVSGHDFGKGLYSGLFRRKKDTKEQT